MAAPVRKKKTAARLHRKIRISQRPINLIDRNFRRARFIRNLQKINTDK